MKASERPLELVCYISNMLVGNWEPSGELIHIGVAPMKSLGNEIFFFFKKNCDLKCLLPIAMPSILMQCNIRCKPCLNGPSMPFIDAKWVVWKKKNCRDG